MARQPRGNNGGQDIDRAASQASDLLRTRKIAMGDETRPLRMEGDARSGRFDGRDRTASFEADRSAGRAASRRTAADAPAPAHARSASHAAGASPMTLGRYVRVNSSYILSVVGVSVLVVLLILFIRLLAPASSAVDDDAAVDAGAGPAGVSELDWDKLDRTDGRFAYVDGGAVLSSLGVDVSDNQQEIDWEAVAADGIDFAMIRLGYRGATEGDLYEDERFWANIEGAISAGLDCGVYFFSQAQTPEEAREEADFVLERIGGATLEYPIAFDSEQSVAGVDSSRTEGLGQEEMTAIANAFCERIEEAGYRAMIYGNVYDLARYDYDTLSDRRVWWAEYDAPVPSHVVDIVMWQYSNGGYVAGIPTAVDMNIDLSGIGR